MDKRGNRTTRLPEDLKDIELSDAITTTEEAKQSQLDPGKNSLAQRRFPIRLDPEPIRQKTLQAKKFQGNYKRFWNIKQAGPGIVAVKDVEPLPIVLIKERRTAKFVKTQLKKTSHKNVLSLLEFFQDSDKVTLVYEYEHSAVALARVSNIPNVVFSEGDIATVCREVLNGLHYIHSELKIIHGSLNCINVLLTMTAEIKIGDSMLSGKTLRDHQCDIKAVGDIASDLSDLSARPEGYGSLHRVPEKATHMTRQFIEKTTKATIQELLKHDFMLVATPSGSWSLKPHILKAVPFGVKFGDYVGEVSA
ncbi:hypothetical protein KXW16_001610 [Aspergillus fumigatus]|nr:hypothetical protein KXW16_001610 [Aspergillus fumigatus]